MMKQRSCFLASGIHRITLVTGKTDNTKVEDLVTDQMRNERKRSFTPRLLTPVGPGEPRSIDNLPSGYDTIR